MTKVLRAKTPSRPAAAARKPTTRAGGTKGGSSTAARKPTTRSGGNKGGSSTVSRKPATRTATTTRAGGTKGSSFTPRKPATTRGGGAKGGGKSRPVLNPPERHLPTPKSDVWNRPTVRRGGSKGGK